MGEIEPEPATGYGLRLTTGDVAYYQPGTPLDAFLAPLIENLPWTDSLYVDLANLVLGFANTFADVPDEASLDQAYSYLESHVPAEDSPEYARSQLALMLGRHQASAGGRLGRPDLLTRAIGNLESVTSADLLDEAKQFLWYAYRVRGEMTESESDYLRSAAVATSIGRTRDAAASHLDAYEISRDTAQLDTALSGLRDVAAAGGLSRKDDADIHYLLGRALRFAGTREALDESVDALTRAVGAADSTKPDMCIYLSNLAFAYRERHLLTGDVGDLDHALNALARSLAASLEQEPQKGRLHNLYQVVQERLNAGGDLDEIINYCALLEARLTLQGDQQLAAAFIALLAERTYALAYQNTRSDYYFIAVALLRRAAGLIPADTVTLFTEQGYDEGTRRSFVARLDALLDFVAHMGIAADEITDYPSALRALADDMITDLRKGGVGDQQLAESSREDRYYVAYFVHCDTLRDAHAAVQ